MDLSFIRRLVAFIYTLILLLFIGFGFCYSNEVKYEYRENTVYFSNYWKVNGRVITFPYENHEEFTMTNTLPTVYGDQMLVLRVYYDSFEVAIDGEVILESRDNLLFGHKTNIGQKEIWIPLEYSYTGCDISVTIDLQDSLYGSQLTEGFITTRSSYGIRQMQQNIPSIILFVVFSVTGVLEMIVAGYYIVKRTALIRKLTFEALFYAGAFSIISAQWIINETRIPFVIWGHMTGFSILNVIAFILMPMMFFELSRALFMRIGKVDNMIDGIIALAIVISCFLATIGTIEWGTVVYVAHAIDLLVMGMVGYYSYTTVKDEQKAHVSAGIAIANFIFLLFAGIALVQYINHIDYNYLLVVIIDLMIFIMVQVGLIYRRIGLNVREEKEFAQAKVYAYTDEMTKLGNRRHFYAIVDDYEQHKLPKDLTYLALDVNRLKYTNDTLGHDAGDELLIGTAECLRRAFNTSSTCTIARMGGDEFAVLLVANETELNRRLFNLKHYLSHWRGKYIDGISLSMGYASVREDPYATVDTLAKLSDERMYEDKKKYYEETGFDRRSPQ